MSGPRWVPVMAQGGPAGYVVLDDGAPRRVDHALPATVPDAPPREPVKVRVSRKRPRP